MRNMRCELGVRKVGEAERENKYDCRGKESEGGC